MTDTLDAPVETNEQAVEEQPIESVVDEVTQIPTISIAETILNWRDEVLAEPQPSWQLVHPHTWFKQSVERLIGKL